MFNALKYTQELEKAGFTRDQAEASVKLLIDVMNENFATKSDLDSSVLLLRTDLESSTQRLRTDLESSTRSLRTDLESSTRSLRSDLDSSVLMLRSELKENTSRLESSIREVEYRMTIKLGAMMTLAIGVTATLVKMLQGLH